MTRTKTILIAWEVGGNFGHAAEIAQLVRHLDARHRIVAAVKDPVTFRSIVADPRIEVIAAPHARDKIPIEKGDQGISYPDVMRFVGWHNETSLAAYLESWEVLFRLVQPDLLVAHAAPTALLAARALGLPGVVMGSGYDAPPRAAPMPRFRHWEPETREERHRREAEVLGKINAALALRGYRGLGAFRDMLDVPKYLLTTLPELDHYGDRGAIEPDHPPYFGLNAASHFGETLRWREDATFRILAYLRPGNPRLEAAIRALVTLPAETDVIFVAPGAPAKLADATRNTSVRLATGPVNFNALFEGCDLGISHASHGLVANFVLNGIPQLGMPNHTEQVMMAHALSNSNLGLGLIGKAKADHILQAIHVVRTSDKVREATARLAAKHSKGIDEVGAHLAREIVSLM